jgi:hypothetical protein
VVRNGSPRRGRRQTKLDNRHDASETPMRSAHHGHWPEEIVVQGPRGAVLRNPHLHRPLLDEKAVEHDLLVKLDESPRGHGLMLCALDLNENR